MRQQARGLNDVSPPTGCVPSVRIGPSRFALLAAPMATLLALFLIMPSEALLGQQPKISVDVKVVNMLATVRDNHGKIVSNLAKDDFVLEEDGRPQTITYFSRESDLPLTLGLLVDTSLRPRRVLDQERRASYSFLDQMLREKDMAFVIHFDREVELLQDLTSSHKKLESALALLEEPASSGSSGGPRGRRGGFGGAGTL